MPREYRSFDILNTVWDVTPKGYTALLEAGLPVPARRGRRMRRDETEARRELLLDQARAIQSRQES